MGKAFAVDRYGRSRHRHRDRAGNLRHQFRPRRGLDGTIGSLEPGKSADFIVLDRNGNPEIPSSEIADTKVLTTWFEEVVHERT